MYAIIETGGKQFRVRPDARVRVPSLAGEPGDRVTFDRVLAASDGESLRPGSPLVDGARVVGEIVRHGRAKKIVVFTFKKRHRFRRKRGHRQNFTEVAIREIALEPQEGAFACADCGRTFASERGLQQHRAKAH